MHPDPEENRRLVRRYFDLLNGGELSPRMRFAREGAWGLACLGGVGWWD
jgi:hypothetical protein